MSVFANLSQSFSINCINLLSYDSFQFRNCVQIFLKHLETPGLACSSVLCSQKRNVSVLHLLTVADSAAVCTGTSHHARFSMQRRLRSHLLCQTSHSFLGYVVIAFCASPTSSPRIDATFTFLRGLARLSRTLSVSSNCLRIR
jgi:hypothetical protein